MAALSVLGILVAAWLKARFVDEEELRFPTGTACADALRSFYESGSNALARTRIIVRSAVAAALAKLLVDSQFFTRFSARPSEARSKLGPLGFLAEVQARIPLRVPWGGYSAADYSLGVGTSLLLLGVGALVGIRVGASLAVGAILGHALAAPWLVEHGAVDWLAIKTPDAIGTTIRTRWLLWPGASLLVSANLISLAWHWRTLVRAIRSSVAVLRRREGASADQVPPAWSLVGVPLVGVVCVALAWAFFGVRPWMGLVAVAASVLMAAVAARAAGETDLVPNGPLGKVTQLIFGLIAPGNVTANLMAANITSGSAAHAAEILTDLKTGHLVGASPRAQLVAQLCGIAVGSLCCVPAYFLLTASAKLGSPELPAPAALPWRAMAEFLVKGAGSLPPYAAAASIACALLGVVLAILDEAVPAVKRFTPNASALGLALVIDPQDSLSIFAGALAAWVLARRRNDWREYKAVSMATGFIAGEGLVGVVLALFRAAKWLR
jgi:uncharacterized oligopeptide transporter (OPT) family protein